MSIADNVKYVQDKVAAAAIAAGKKPEDIGLVAATKMNSADRVREAIAAGIKICGGKQSAGACGEKLTERL